MSDEDKRYIDATKDALALLRCAQRGDRNGVEALLDTFRNADDIERGMLLGGLLAHSVAILNLASRAIDVPSDTILASVGASLNEAV